MKKIIFKIATATLLMGGLAFNFSLNNTKSNQDIDLKSLTEISKAYAKSGGGLSRSVACWGDEGGCTTCDGKYFWGFKGCNFGCN
jgi:hypothetical protein